jgi:hypothetical protein
LTTCTISNDTFDIILNQSHGPPHQRSDSSYPLQYHSPPRTTFPNPICSCNQKNPSSDQSSSMNQSRYRCRSFHPISQPHMKSYLSTFSQSTPQESQTNPICICSRSPCCSHQRCICTSQIPPTQKQTYQENSIADTIYLHCFLSRFGPALSMKPKSNQQITTHSNHFPTNQKSTLIIGCDQYQHRTSKQTLITHKSRQMRIMLHISKTVNMNTQTHCTYCDHHRCTQRVKTLEPIHTHCMSSKPFTLRTYHSGTHGPNFIKSKIALPSAGCKTLYSHTPTTSSTLPSTSLSRESPSLKRSKDSTQIHYSTSFFLAHFIQYTVKKIILSKPTNVSIETKNFHATIQEAS